MPPNTDVSSTTLRGRSRSRRKAFVLLGLVGVSVAYYWEFDWDYPDQNSLVALSFCIDYRTKNPNCGFVNIAYGSIDVYGGTTGDGSCNDEYGGDPRYECQTRNFGRSFSDLLTAKKLLESSHFCGLWSNSDLVVLRGRPSAFFFGPGYRDYVYSMNGEILTISKLPELGECSDLKRINDRLYSFREIDESGP